jgi:hypothetical protein
MATGGYYWDTSSSSSTTISGEWDSTSNRFLYYDTTDNYVATQREAELVNEKRRLMRSVAAQAQEIERLQRVVHAYEHPPDPVDEMRKLVLQ